MTHTDADKAIAAIREMTATIDVLLAYQAEMGWNDNTLVALLADFIDHEKAAERLRMRLERIATEERD